MASEPIRALDLPPLLTGMATPDDPFATACAAADSAEPGTVFYGLDAAVMRAAVLLAPETPLKTAIGVSFAASLGMNDAFGALAPAEVAMHLVWPGGFRVNGALAGRMRAASDVSDADAVPDWLVLGVEIDLASDDGTETGRTPEITTLHAEGCGGITSADLTEAWGRHFMNWLHIYLTDGFAPLHEMWRDKAYRMGETVEHPEAGTFIGLDELGGMLLKTKGGTRLHPLTELLETV